MFVSHHTLKWTRTCRSHGRHPHAHTAHFLLNRHIHSLFNFKRKFQPAEAPVYVCYPDPAALPQIGLAVVRAYVPSVTPAEVAGMLSTLRLFVFN